MSASARVFTSILPAILCGGAGRRLAPLSTPSLPKQFLRLDDPALSLLQQTLMRVRKPDIFAPPVLFGSVHHHAVLQQQIDDMACVPAALFLEPVMRNTAAPVFLAALYAARTGYEYVLVLPSDHVIANEQAFVEDIRHAAEGGAVISYFGIAPDSPRDCFGYLYEEAGRGIRFHEKPDTATAQTLIGRGALWNSGIFLLRTTGFLAEAACVAPDLLEMLSMHSLEAYEHIAPIPFDTAFCEQTGCGRLYRARFDWVDLGNWVALNHHASKKVAI